MEATATVDMQITGIRELGRGEVRQLVLVHGINLVVAMVLKDMVSCLSCQYLAY